MYKHHVGIIVVMLSLLFTPDKQKFSETHFIELVLVFDNWTLILLFINIRSCVNTCSTE